MIDKLNIWLISFLSIIKYEFRTHEYSHANIHIVDISRVPPNNVHACITSR